MLTTPFTVRSPLLWLLSGFLLLSAGGPAAWADPLAEVRDLSAASLYVESPGRPALAYQAEMPRVPASTLKLLTAYAALETWGRAHRFHTDVATDRDGWIWVKGGGDPWLVSEELDRLVEGLRQRGLSRVTGIGVDDSLFDPALEIAGRSDSRNPYDAPLTALAANFNSVAVERQGQAVRSGEAQTPLTPTARALALSAPEGRDRLSLVTRERALRHFAELLAAKLRAAGIEVGTAWRLAEQPRDARLLYRHRNSRTLEAQIAPMLEYSNNFIANALFVHLAAPDDQGQVDMAEARAAMRRFVRERFGWDTAVIEDGAGLSRGNRLSARQLVELLAAFEPYRDLLPEQHGNPSVRAKTGTLSGVSCYAGFVRQGSGWARFALLINQPTDAGLRLRFASALAR